MTIGAATVRVPRARPARNGLFRSGPTDWSLAQQYVVASLIVVLVGVLVTGAWIGHQIETSVLDRTAGVTALYVDSFLSETLQGLARDDRWLTPSDTEALDHLISDTGLGQGVVLFKIWSIDGRVLYSPDRSLVGQQFPLNGGLASATRGEVTVVKRGSDTIRKQQAELRQRLDQNQRLHERVRQAAGRTTALNDQALRRISADLHDGPGQVLALALLRLDALQAPLEDGDRRAQTRSDFATVHAAVRDALSEVRAISAGLRLPELGSMSVEDVAQRAIDEHQRRSDTRVARRLEDLPSQAPLATKIALVRTLQEALSNATCHAGGEHVLVHLIGGTTNLRLTVSDRGPGFDPEAAERSGRLGLAGMRERAELLGGSFEVESRPGVGTIIRASWPLQLRDEA